MKSFQIILGSGDLHYIVRAVWSNFMLFLVVFLAECCDAVSLQLQQCFADEETSPNFLKL